MRDDALRACREVENTKQRYILKEEFSELDRFDKCEALLWLVWPYTLRYKHSFHIIGEETGHYLRALVKQHRAVKVARGEYRYMPEQAPKKKPHTIAV